MFSADITTGSFPLTSGDGQDIRVLVVGGDQQPNGPLVSALARRCREVVAVTTGTAAFRMHERADWILLDLELPDIDGLEICRRIRNLSDIPIIAFTDRGADHGRIRGLRAGADDCLAKPFQIPELLARMEAVMRRIRPRDICLQRTPSLSIGPLTVDATTREVTLHGRAIELTRKEFDLLHHLVRNRDTVLTRARLMAEIWDDPSACVLGPRATRTIDTHVNSLRNKLGDGSWIRTVRGVGFQLGHNASHVATRVTSDTRSA